MAEDSPECCSPTTPSVPPSPPTSANRRPNAANPTGLYVPKLSDQFSELGGREGPHRPGHGKKILYGKSMGKWTVGTHGSMLKVKGLSLQRGLPITFLHKFLPVVMAFFQDSTFACLALFPPGQSRPRRMYGNLLSCILVKRHSFSPYV